MRQQDIDAAEIRRLVDDGAESWQTTEKPVMQEAEYHCGGTRALANTLHNVRQRNIVLNESHPFGVCSHFLRVHFVTKTIQYL